jgi:hypothetical protein
VSPPGASGFAIPFVDYARGDGQAVGPGHPREWRPEPIDDDTPWVRGFRGLWGLDTHDSFGGERAPAGPRYERQGGVRRSWVDPLGWAGLDAVVPTAAEEAASLRTRIDALTERLQVLDRAVADERTALRGLQAEARSLGAKADTRSLQRERLAELTRRRAALTRTVAERSALADEREAHEDFLARPAGLGPPDAHLQHVHLPDVVDRERHSAFLRIWATVSTPVLILGIGLLLTGSSAALLSGFAMFLLAFIAVEAVARRRIGLFFVGVAVAVVWLFIGAGLFVLFLRNWQLLLAGLLIVVALVLLVVNLREFGRPARGERRAPP